MKTTDSIYSRNSLYLQKILYFKNKVPECQEGWGGGEDICNTLCNTLNNKTKLKKKKFQEIKTEVLNFINVKISFIFDINICLQFCTFEHTFLIPCNSLEYRKGNDPSVQR